MVASDIVKAAYLSEGTDSNGFPFQNAWNSSESVFFDSDWQGKNSDPECSTEVRLLWNPESLFLQYRSRYRTLTVFNDADPSGRRDHLWDRDVVEIFIQSDPTYPGHYLEFEVSPNGFWIDLDIEHGDRSDAQSGMKCRTNISERAKIWTADLLVPMRSLARHFDPSSIWRVNFFRVEGENEPRFYSSWRPTNTPQPNFHVPTAFGKMKFLPPMDLQ